MSLKQTQHQQTPHIQTEEILAVRRKILFEKTTEWQGINHEIFNDFVSLIEKNIGFLPRAHAETNYNYKQIIPYLIFTVHNKFFVTQRKATASEQRLASKYSLGLGGHIRKEDIVSSNIFDWSKREFDEEVSYPGSFNIKTIGVLNDETSPVSKVHLGLVLLLEGNTENITIKDEHKSGTLLTLEECQKIFPNMENWSKIVFQHLCTMKL